MSEIEIGLRLIEGVVSAGDGGEGLDNEEEVFVYARHLGIVEPGHTSCSRSKPDSEIFVIDVVVSDAEEYYCA